MHGDGASSKLEPLLPAVGEDTERRKKSIDRRDSVTSSGGRRRKSLASLDSFRGALSEGSATHPTSPFGGTATKAKEYLRRPSLFSESPSARDIVADVTPSSGLGSSVVEDFAQRKKLYGKGKRIELEWWFSAKDWSVLWLHGYFYYTYALYIVGLMFTGAILMWALDPEGDLLFKDAIYMAAACVSQSGLATVNWSAQANSSHVLSFLLIIGGSMSLLTLVPAFLRRRSFRLQAHADLQRTTQQTAEEASDVSSVASSDTASVHSFVTALELEYNALGLVIKIVLGYWFVVHLSCFLIMYFYIQQYPDILEELGELNLGSVWHTLYLTVSSFQNNGLVLTPSSLENYKQHCLILMVVSFLILAGNTGLPIFIRVVFWTVWRLCPEGDTKMALAFLLEHPRRCYTHLFPGQHTLWLVLVLISLDGLPILVIMLFDYNSEAMVGLSASQKLANAVVNSVSARTAGVNSIDIYNLSLVSNFILMVAMYISTSPTVVTMRLSALRQSGVELDLTGRSEGLEDAVEADNTVRSQARRYLTQDVTYLTVILFLILANENDSFKQSALQVTQKGDGYYNDFDFFKVCYEMASAYGTVGLSLGYRNAAYSFSGAWTVTSQMLLVVVMILGRLLGLPDSIDPSVSSTMHRREERDQRITAN